MAPNEEIARALAIACLNQPSFVETLVSLSTVNKAGDAKDAKLLGQTVEEFYEAIYKGVRKTFRQP